MSKLVSEEEKLLEFLYAAPVGLVEIDAVGNIAMINPHAMKHLLPLAGTRDAGNLFSMLEDCAPELRNMFDDFLPDRGTICDGHRIAVDLHRRDGADLKVLACTLVKLDAHRAMASISDISLQVAQEQRLKQAETWFASLLNDVNDYAVLSITSDGTVDSVTASWQRQTGYARETLLGCQLKRTLPIPAGGGQLGMREQLRLAARDGWYLDESWHSRSDGTRYWCQRLLAARSAANGELTGFTVVLRDVARQEHAADDLRRLLTQDHLTGAANRAHFQQQLDRAQRDWQDRGEPLSLLMLDIDHFKRVNDVNGHPAGDRVLSHFANTLSAALRPTDLLARLGGEEFAILLPATSLKDAVAMAERLRILVAEMRVETANGDVTVTVSLGCATAAVDDDLLEAADRALYAAKHAGRNRVHVYEPGSLAA